MQTIEVWKFDPCGGILSFMNLNPMYEESKGFARKGSTYRT